MRTLLLVALVGCNKDPDLTGIPNLPGGNPLVPDEPMFPFPSDFYLVDDASTATGKRVAFPAEALPEGLPPEMFVADGFSRVQPILALLDGGVDPASLPDPHDPGASIADGSPVWLLRADDGARVPVLAEVDGQAAVVADQALIVRPHVALDPATTYVVVLRDGLRTADGGAHEPTKAFRALRDGLSTDSDAVESLRDDFETVNAAIAAQGLDPEEVVLAWSFTTRSREEVTAPLLAMHDEMMAAELGAFVVESDTVDGDNRLIRGTFTAPDFLGDDSRIALDGGAPVVRGTKAVDVLVTLPIGIDGPRPVMVFGHGFFSSIEEPTWSSLNDSLHRWEMSAVSTKFLGFNEEDQIASLGILGGEMARLGEVVDQQLQSQANHTAMVRVIREQLADDVPELDPDAIVYMGISNGGTQGLTLLTASPNLSRGAFVVPGGGWSHMLQRAVQWNTLGGLLETRYPDPAELQLVMSLAQIVFDPVDSLNWVDKLVNDRFPGRPPVEVTVHMAVGDCQVANLVTEWVVRTAQIPVVTPSTVVPWGVEQVTAPEPGGNAAMLVYDEGYPPLPEGNLPPATDNGAHETIRGLEAYKQQMGTFLETGRIVQVCDGACDPD